MSRMIEMLRFVPTADGTRDRRGRGVRLGRIGVLILLLVTTLLPVTIVLSPSRPAAAQAPETEPTVTQVRVGRHRHYTRIVLDASDIGPFAPRLSGDAHRLVIPLASVRWAAPRSRDLTETDFLVGFRYVESDPDGPALIIEGATPLVLRNTLSLAPDAYTDHYRYVIDLAPSPARPARTVDPSSPPERQDDTVEADTTSARTPPIAETTTSGPEAVAETAPPTSIRVTGVRIGRHPEKARLVLDAAGETRFRPIRDADGRSVRIRFAAVDWKTDTAREIAAIPFLTRFAFESADPGGDFVVEANRPIQILTALVLAPGGDARGYRYVLDLAPLPIALDQPPPPDVRRPPEQPAPDDHDKPVASPRTEPDPTAWTPPDPESAFAAVESYMEDLETLQARFVQVVDETHRLSGTFRLHRPGRMRLEYDPPIKDFFVADGWFLFYWDDDLGQQSSTPIGSTLADFILRENFSLSDDVTVTRLRLAPGRIAVTVVQRDDPAAGSLTMTFAEAPVRLLQWTVDDNSGHRTRVVLSDIRTGLALDDALFYFVRPRPAPQHDR